MFAKIKSPALLAMTAVLLAGCASTATHKANDTYQGAGARVAQGLERFAGRPGLRPGGAQVNDGIFVAAARQAENPAAKLPSRVQTAGAVRLESRDAMTLPEIVGRLTEITGIPHLAAMGPTGAPAPTAVDSAITADLMMGGAQAAPSGTRVVNAAGQQSDRTMTPSLQGPLSSVLDEVSAFFDAEWSYDDGRVVLRDYVTRQYQVVALPGETSGSNSVGGGSMSSSSSMSVSFWKDIQEAMAAVAGDGANISMGTGTGIITVTARVNDHSRVAEYVEKVNASMGQQITFDVNVLTVSLNDEDDYGFDIGAAFSNLAPNLNVSFNSAAASGVGGAVNIGFLNSEVDFSSVVSALSTMGKVAVETRTGVTTSNNRVAPVEVVRKQSFAAKTEVVDLPDGGSRTSVTPDSLTTGFAMQLFPRILNNREIMVQYAIDISELNGFRTFSSNGGSVELPDTNQTTFEQQAMLSNGQTLILAGFERTRVNLNEAGTGSSGFMGLGGSKKAESERVATVVMITPRLINRQGAVYASAQH
jgi:hypothetical protein